jgi:hypothetical protein
MEQSNQSLSFPEAISTTQELIEKIEQKQLNETETEKAIAELVQTQAGARGFFVAYLTRDNSLADNPPEGVIKGLQSSPKIVSDLLVKNVAMSAAMELTHLRNEDKDAAVGSQMVNSRTIELIQQLKMKEVQHEAQKLQSTITKGEGSYQKFLTRWGYDEEQQVKIQEAISSIE